MCDVDGWFVFHVCSGTVTINIVKCKSFVQQLIPCTASQYYFSFHIIRNFMFYNFEHTIFKSNSCTQFSFSYHLCFYAVYTEVNFHSVLAYLCRLFCYQFLFMSQSLFCNSRPNNIVKLKFIPCSILHILCVFHIFMWVFFSIKTFS